MTPARKKITASFIFLAVAGLVMLVFISDETLRNTLSQLKNLGAGGQALFIALYALGCVFLVPGFLFTYGAGALFGISKGIICVSAGATLGASLSFLIGRYLARPWVEEEILKNKHLQLLDRSVAREGWKIVLLARLCPLIPFRLSNYVFGLSDIPLTKYIVASWAGTLPSASVYVYVGSLLGDLSNIKLLRTRSPVEWGFLLFGAGMLVVTLWYVGRLTRNVLAEEKL